MAKDFGSEGDIEKQGYSMVFFGEENGWFFKSLLTRADAECARKYGAKLEYHYTLFAPGPVVVATHSHIPDSPEFKLMHDTVYHNLLRIVDTMNERKPE